MATPVSLMDDQMVDMAFITQLTGLTDKWFYKLIKDGGFPAPIKMERSSRWLNGFAPIFPDICYHLTHYKP
ncbi:helix-turn-helix transcriptional regulator, partial [Escherichia coli]|uniref:helix-turn-helix transcriptional regulator n=1 Tax=Escherichia coli TaxID=562 RepID=UPI003D69E816